MTSSSSAHALSESGARSRMLPSRLVNTGYVYRSIEPLSGKSSSTSEAMPSLDFMSAPLTPLTAIMRSDNDRARTPTLVQLTAFRSH